MSQPMRIETAVEGLMVITPRLANVLVWTIFCVIHLSTLVIALASIWWFQISPASIQSEMTNFLRSSPGATILQTVSFLGISGAAVLWAYAKLWRWGLHKMLSAILFAE